jgi:hypothetical protein
LYARQQEDAFLPKVIGQAKADSYDLPGIMEDEHINSRYSITFVDDGKFLQLLFAYYFQMLKIPCI